MKFRSIILTALCLSLVAPGIVKAQSTQRFSADVRERTIAPDERSSLSSWAAQPQRKDHAVLIGALIGAGAALVGTGLAASKYGENEGGKFCSPCMVQWSAVAVPVGAAIGAGIGYGVKRARRSVVAVPVISRRAAAVVVAARF